MPAIGRSNSSKSAAKPCEKSHNYKQLKTLKTTSPIRPNHSPMARSPWVHTEFRKHNPIEAMEEDMNINQTPKQERVDMRLALLFGLMLIVACGRQAPLEGEGDLYQKGVFGKGGKTSISGGSAQQPPQPNSGPAGTNYPHRSSSTHRLISTERATPLRSWRFANPRILHHSKPRSCC